MLKFDERDLMNEMFTIWVNIILDEILLTLQNMYEYIVLE